jgi:flagellar biosynthesis anti-sigma factor FlgM
MSINKVPPYSTDAVQNPNAAASRKGADTQESIKNGVAPSDRVELSKDYQKLAQTQKTMMSGEEVRTDKVDRIRRQLADGRYKIAPEGIAEKMLDEIV